MLHLLAEEPTETRRDLLEQTNVDDSVTSWRESPDGTTTMLVAESSRGPAIEFSMPTLQSSENKVEQRLPNTDRFLCTSRNQQTVRCGEATSGKNATQDHAIRVLPVFAAKLKRTRSNDELLVESHDEDDDDDEERAKRAKLLLLDNEDDLDNMAVTEANCTDEHSRQMFTYGNDGGRHALSVAMTTGSVTAYRSVKLDGRNDEPIDANFNRGLIDVDYYVLRDDEDSSRRSTVVVASPKDNDEVENGGFRTVVKEDKDCRRPRTADNTDDVVDTFESPHKTTRTATSASGDDNDDEYARHHRSVECSLSEAEQRSRRFPLDRLLQTVGLECVVRFIAAAHQRTGDLPEHLRQLLGEERMLFGEPRVDRNGSAQLSNFDSASPNGHRSWSTVHGKCNEELRRVDDFDCQYSSPDRSDRSQLTIADLSHGQQLKNSLLNLTAENCMGDLVRLLGGSCGPGFSPVDFMGRLPNLGLFGSSSFQQGVNPPQLLAIMMMMMAPPFGACPPQPSITTMQPQSSGASTVPSKMMDLHSTNESTAAAAVPLVSDDVRRQQQQQQQSTTSRRVRTRITADQLAVLRARFDISAGTPSDDELASISVDAGLPPKVVKHWFRNTLFKERQRSKDSPYNFAIPPGGKPMLDAESPACRTNGQRQDDDSGCRMDDGAVRRANNEISDNRSFTPNDAAFVSSRCQSYFGEKSMVDTSDKIEYTKLPCEVSSTIEPEHVPVNPDSGVVHPNFHGFPFGMTPSMVASSTAVSVDAVAATASQLCMATADQRQVEHQFTYQQHSFQPQQQHQHGKRASRTHFTDDQVQVLHEHFERNAYPRDDELEALSRRLGLSARVIVVWFQNARQKARRNYENQNASSSTATTSAPCSMSFAVAPAGHPDGVGSPSGSRSGLSSSDDSCGGGTSSLRYECKLCPAVFQRYYDLVKHHRCHSVDQQPASAAVEQRQTTIMPTTAVDVKPTAVRTCPPFVSMATDHSDRYSNSHSQLAGLPWPTPTPSSLAVDLGRLATLLSPRGFDSVQSSMSKAADQRSSEDEDDTGSEEDDAGIVRSSVLNLKAQTSATSRNKCDVDVADGLKCERRLSSSSQTVSHDLVSSKDRPDFTGNIGSLTSFDPNVKTEVGNSDEDRSLPVWYGYRSAANGSDVCQENTKDENCGFEVTNMSDGLTAAVEEPSSSPDDCSTEYRSQSVVGSPHAVRKPSEPFPSMPVHRPYNESAQQATSIGRSPVDSVEPSMPSMKRLIDETPLDLSSSNAKTGSDPMANRTIGRAAGAPVTAMTTSANVAASTSPAGEATGRSSSSKRHRTHMSDHQVRVMRAIYTEHRTPSIGECATVGAKIGLARRVVQVWFQNARAKDKKKAASNSDGVPDEQRQQLVDEDMAADTDADSVSSTGTNSGGPVQCRWCGVVYTATRCAAREHLFSAEHVGAVDRVVRTTTAAIAANVSAAETQRGRSSKRERRRSLASSFIVNAGGIGCKTSVVAGQMTSPSTSRSSVSGGEAVSMSPSELPLYIGE